MSFAAVASFLGPALLKAAPSIAGFASNFFKPKSSGGETINVENLLPSYQQDSLNQLSAFVKQFLPNFKPGEAYGGDFTAGTTDLEKTGLSQLGDFLKAPGTGETFAAGKENLLKTLSGAYADPAQSPFLQAMQKLSQRGLDESITGSRRSAGARGSFFTKGAIAEEGKLREGSQMNLDALIGGLIDTERGRQFSAIPLAQQFDQFENLTAPLTKIGASQTFGGLERTIEQSDLEAKYQDFVRQQKEKQIPLQVAQGLAGGQPFISERTAPVQEQPSSLQNILSMISKLNLGALGKEGGSIFDIFKQAPAFA